MADLAAAGEARSGEVLSEDFGCFGEICEEDVGDLREERCEREAYDTATCSKLNDLEVFF